MLRRDASSATPNKLDAFRVNIGAIVVSLATVEEGVASRREDDSRARAGMLAAPVARGNADPSVVSDFARRAKVFFGKVCAAMAADDADDDVAATDFAVAVAAAAAMKGAAVMTPEVFTPEAA